MTEKRTDDDPILRERWHRIFSVRTLVFFLLSLALGVLLVRQLEWGRTLETLRGADPWLLAACVAIYALSNLCKSLRYGIMLKDESLGRGALYTVTSYQNFFNMILPARTGELTLLYYLKKLGGASVAKGLHSLVITRIFDFIIISLFFVLSLTLVYGAQTSPALLGMGIVFCLASVAILFNLRWLVTAGDAVARRLAQKLGLAEHSLVKKVLERLEPLVREFTDYRAGGQFLALGCSSVLVWVVLYSLFFVSIRAMGIAIDPLRAVAGSTGGVLANVLPINSIGSFGTLEAGWAGGFILVGMDKQDAIVSGFGYHIISFAASAIMALICFAAQRLASRRP